jgi:hypothetical protein
VLLSDIVRLHKGKWGPWRQGSGVSAQRWGDSLTQLLASARRDIGLYALVVLPKF